MPTLESHILEDTRTYLGEEAAESLINWLNFTQDTPGRARIIEVIGTFMRRCVLGVSVPEDAIVERDGSFYQVETDITASREDLNKRLEILLSYYTVVPSITFPSYTGSAPVTMPYFIFWKPAPGSKLDKQQLRFDETAEWKDEFDLPGVQMAESGAIRVALDLMQTGLIWKVSRCRCEKFYFRRFSHQRFCSTKCRLADSRDSDDARKKRNEYARKLYQLKKSGKVK